MSVAGTEFRIPRPKRRSSQAAGRRHFAHV